MERWADKLASSAVWVGRIGAWASVPLMLVILVDVVTRRFFVLGSIKLQELEWHLHTIIFASCLGFAFVRGAHVRIDLIRESLSERKKLWIEIVGFFAFLLPFSLLVLYVTFDFAWTSFDFNERSSSPGGLPHRWMIKGAIPIGMFFLLLAGISALLRSIFELLRGPLDRRPESDYDTTPKA